MPRFARVFVISFVAIIQSAITVAAGDVALVIGNRNYQRASWMYDAEQALNATRDLRNTGFAVVSGRDLSSDQTRNALHGFVNRLSDAKRAVIVLNGHFVHSDNDTWFVPINAFPPNPISINYEGLSLNTILNLAGRIPGGAAVFLGTFPRPIDVSNGIEPGLGTLDIPQGVLVVTGKPDDIATTLRRDFLAEDVGFADALAQAPQSIAAQGFISNVGRLAPRAAGQGQGFGSTDEGYWQAVNDIGSEDALRAYLNAFPDGDHADEAQDRLDALVAVSPQEMAKADEAALRLSRKQRGKIQENLSLLGYDTRGIDGIFGRGSRRAIAGWQSDQGFDATGYVTQRQLNRLNRQAERKAEELAEEARQKQRELEDADRRFWQSSGAASGNERGLRRYLRNYPDGLFADVAVVRLEAIEEAARQNVSNAERNAWDIAESLDSIEGYGGYLSQYPNGVFSDEAKARLVKLEEEAASQAANAAAKQEEANLNLNGFARVLVEQQLSALGFDAGPLDGKFDKKTRRAIRRFQKARGFPVTGFLSRQTIVRLIAEAGG